jgi:hypothetical protein
MSEIKHKYFASIATKHSLACNYIITCSECNYIFVLPTSFLRIPKTQPHFITGMTCKCIALLFFLQTNIFRCYPRVGRTVYVKTQLGNNHVRVGSAWQKHLPTLNFSLAVTQDRRRCVLLAVQCRSARNINCRLFY